MLSNSFLLVQNYAYLLGIIKALVLLETLECVFIQELREAEPLRILSKMKSYKKICNNYNNVYF